MIDSQLTFGDDLGALPVVKAQESMEMEIAEARGIGSTGDNDSLDNKCFALDRSKRIFSEIY